MIEREHTLIRHPGESRDPGFQLLSLPKVWVPTSVGMTDRESVK